MDVNRHADDAGLVCDGACDPLTDPPRGVGRELATATVLDRSTAFMSPRLPSWMRSSSGIHSAARNGEARRPLVLPQNRIGPALWPDIRDRGSVGSDLTTSAAMTAVNLPRGPCMAELGEGSVAFDPSESAEGCRHLTRTCCALSPISTSLRTATGRQAGARRNVTSGASIRCPMETTGAAVNRGVRAISLR